MNRQDYIKLCVKDITENISDFEKEKLFEWIGRSSENKTEYERLKKVWTESAPGKLPEVPDLDIEWMKLSNRLELNTSSNKKDSFFDKLAEYFQAKFPIVIKPLGAAAIVVLLAIVGVNLFYNNGSEHELIEITTEYSMNKSVLLPDGSEVILNSGSQLSYSNSFNESSREVKLKGVFRLL